MRTPKWYPVPCVGIVVLCFHTLCLGAQAPLFQSDRFTVYPDRVVEGSFSAQVTPSGSIQSNYPVSDKAASAMRTWSPDTHSPTLPKLTSGLPLVDALYELSLQELTKDTRSDGTFGAGAEWPGVWTRDTSYSTYLSLAMLDPNAAKNSLMAKVKRDRIIQDTGTGGSWPVSSDRECWALAAWQIYLVTGDRQWLANSYRIIRNSITDDESTVIDPADGLVHGESSLMDWREQTYPRWLQPVDIYNSKSLSTSTIFFAVYRILDSMAKELRIPGTIWNAKAERLRLAVNTNFWLAEQGYYGEYRYGPAPQYLSPRSEALGESLAILTGLAPASRQTSLLASVPVMEFGIPTVYPQSAGIPAYHNRSVWPFVEAFWTMAAAKLHDEQQVSRGLASIYRASALFLTNKENFVVDTGNPVGTVINSDRQLWSVAGNLAMTYRVLFGMDFQPNGIHLSPVVPAGYGQLRSLSNFHYRDAVLSIVVKGTGSRVQSAMLDGRRSSPFFPATLHGNHTLVVQLSAGASPGQPSHVVQQATAPEAPVAVLQDSELSWAPTPRALRYVVFRNAMPWQTTTGTSVQVPSSTTRTTYQVAAIATDELSSFLSAPVDTGHTIEVKLGGQDHAYLETNQQDAPRIRFDFDVPTSGKFLLTFLYANGSGPINTDSKCAIRTLFLDGSKVGPIVMPQRGQDEWNDFGPSSGQTMELRAGHHTGTLSLESSDFNMDGKTNTARLRSLLLEVVR